MSEFKDKRIRGNYNPVLEERRKEEKAQSRKNQKKKERDALERLKTSDPIRLLKSINGLQRIEKEGGKLSSNQVKLLNNLNQDLKLVKKHDLHKDQIDRYLNGTKIKEQKLLEKQTKPLGSKSIYFDPEWNPTGEVPKLNDKYLPNITHPIKKDSKDFKIYDFDASIISIPLPSGPAPRFYKKINAQIVVEGEAKEIAPPKPTTQFIPTIIRKKPLLKEQSKPVTLETSADYDSDQYASEEEEYLIRMGKLPDKKRKVLLEDVQDESFS